MAEELNVKIKADSSKLTEELNKVGKTVDSLNKKSSTIQIKTNYAEIVRNLSKLKSNLDKITGNSNISIGLTTGQTLNRLKAIDDRLKSIRKNSNITINVKEKVNQPKRNSASTLSALTQDISPKATITTYPTATYKTLQQQARNAALQAEKNFNTGDFDSYKNEFMDRMKQLVNFKKALGDISVGQERGIYTNMARSLNSTNPVYSSLIDKIKELNKEQSKLNSLTKDNTNLTKANTTATRAKVRTPNPVDNTRAKVSAFEDMTGAELLAYGTRFVGRSSKGVGSFGEAVAQATVDASRLDSALGRAIVSGGALTAIFGAWFGLIDLSVGALSSVGQGIAAIFRPGIEFITNMELLRNGLAGALASIGQIGGEQVKFNDALKISDNLVKQISFDAIDIGVKPEELVGVFRSTVEPGLQAGMNISQIRKMSSMFTTVGKEMGLNDVTLTRDVSDIFTGQNVQRTKIGQQLGLSNDDIAQAKESADGLYKFLEDRLSGYVEANANFKNTLLGAWTQLEGTATLASASIAQAFEPVFVELMHEVASYFGTIKENEDTGEKMFVPSDNVLKLIDAFENLGLYIASAIDYVIAWAEAFTNTDDPIIAVTELIEELIGFVIISTTTILTFGKGVVDVFTFIIHPIWVFVNIVQFAYNSVMALASAIHSLWDAGKGDIGGASALRAQAQQYLDAANTNLHPEPLDKQFGANTIAETGGGKFAQQYRELIKQVKLDFSTSKSGINPDAIGTRFPSKEDEAAKKKAAKEAIKESQDMLKEHRAALKEVLDDTLDKLKDELEQNEVAFKEGFKSMQDYYNQKAELERQEAQARLQEAQAEREAINNSLFNSDYEKLKAIHEVDRNIAKYSKALEKSTKTQKEIADSMQSLTTSMDNIGAMVNNESTSGGSPTGTTVNTGINPKTGTLDNITGMSNEEISYRVMTSQGFSDAIATGIIASVQGESLSNPRDVHFDRNGPSMGIASWHDVDGEGGGRMTDLINFAKENNSDAYDIRTQLAFLIHEITSGTQVEAFKNALAYFNANGKTAEAMAKAWTIYVERPADAQGEAERRSMNVAGVREILQQANNRPAVQQQAQASQQVNTTKPAVDDANQLYRIRTMDTDLSGENKFWVKQLDSVDVKNLLPEAKLVLNNLGLFFNDLTKMGLVPEGVVPVVTSGVRDNGEHVNRKTIDVRYYNPTTGDDWDTARMDLAHPKVYSMLETFIEGQMHAGFANEYKDATYGGWHNHINASGKNWTGGYSNQGTTINDMQWLYNQQSNPMITNNAPSTSKEASKAKSDAKDLIEKALKTNVDTFSEVLGIGLKAQLAQLEAEYTRKIDEAKGTPVIAELLKTQKIYKINELMSNYLEKMIDFNLGRMEETISDRAEEIATGKADAGAIIGKYFKYFNQVVDKNSSLAVQNVANQIQDLEGQFANAQRGGQIELAEKIRVKLRATVAKLYSYFDTIISAIDKQFENISNMFATIPMTNLQKEQGEKEIKAYKARAEVNVRQSEEYYGRSNYIALQNTISGLEESQKKLKAGSEEAIKLQGIIAIKNDELIAQKKKLEDNHTALELAKRLAEIPTLLDDIHTTSKQALEDGLVTFLTDGVNEAKNLGEALKNMAVTFLKTMQQMFAKKLVLDLMNKWFKVKDQDGVKKATTGALSTQMDFSHPTYQYKPPALTNSIFGASNYAQYSFNNKKPKYGFDSQSLGLQSSPLVVKPTVITPAPTIEMTKGVSTEQFTIAPLQQAVESSAAVITEMATGIRVATTNLQSFATTLQQIQATVPTIDTGIVKKATGGLISGAGTSTSDSIPAMLSNSEYVMKADAVKQYGLNFMNSVNSGHFSGIQVRKFATGGSVSGQASENTAKGMETFGKSIGNNASFTGNYNLILAGNQQEAMDAYMKSPAGQRAMLTFNKNYASIISRLGR